MRIHLVAWGGLAILAAAAPAMAADTGFYGGVGLGDFRTEVELSDYAYFVDDFDESDVGFKVFGGYRFFRWLAVEASYTDGGSPKARIFQDAELRLDAAFAVSALTGAAVFTLPVGERFELFLKPGFAYWQVDAKLVATDAFGRVTERGDDTDYAFFLGGGVGFNLSEQFGLRLEYEAFEPGENFDFEEGIYNQDIATRFLSASVLFRF